jgi:hypothetical protein
VAATPEPDEGGCSGVQVFLIERYHLRIQASQKREDHWAGIMAQPRGQYHGGFEDGGNSHHYHFGSADSFDQPFMAGLPQEDGSNGRTIQNYRSIAFRPIAQDTVFLLATHHSPQLAGWHRGPHAPLQVIPEALMAPRLTSPCLEPGSPFQQSTPDGFRLGLMGQARHLTSQSLDVDVLDVQRHGGKLPNPHHATSNEAPARDP